ncbi:MAG: hypothetical protein WA632_01905 [Gallionella sp.]
MMIDIHSQKSHSTKRRDMTVKNIIVLVITAAVVWSEVLIHADTYLNLI